MKIEPITLEGHVVYLEPLSMDYVEDLYEAAQDPSIWLYMPTNPGRSRADMVAWIRAALRGQEEGTDLPFVIIDRATNRVVGATRYMNVSSKDRGLEIGWTWLAKEARRTGINTECKYLLLRHAFEQIDCIAVEFRTGSVNFQSRNAIERLGAKFDGILRSHQRYTNGALRDTCVYSITAAEWPTVKAHLEWQMRKPR